MNTHQQFNAQENRPGDVPGKDAPGHSQPVPGQAPQPVPGKPVQPGQAEPGKPAPGQPGRVEPTA